MHRPLSLDELDTACVAHWREGALPACRRAATRLLERARDAGDLEHEARAELHLALCHQRENRYSEARAAARRAAALARQGRDVEIEIEALSLASAAACAIGQGEAAIESAELALQLATRQGAELLAVQAADALGLACAWTGRTGASRRAFASGATFARQSDRTDWATHIAIHVAFAEALMLAVRTDWSARSRPDADIDRVRSALDAALSRCEIRPGVLSPGIQRSGRVLIGWVQAMRDCWEARPADAARRLSALEPLLRRERAWLLALWHWAKAAEAAARRDWHDAEVAAKTMLERAREMGHQPLLEQAWRIWTLALLRQDALSSALAPADWIDARRPAPGTAEDETVPDMVAHELRLRSLDPAPGALPDWRREDALTGLASREYFQMQADDLLRRTDPTRAQITLLVLALDPGQVLAAHHSPLVRDRVLCTLAAVLRQTLRSGDLPARWSQDELAVLLQRAGADDAGRIGERIVAAVRAHDWSAIASGLEVRVCIGHAGARVGDTLIALMRRSESSRLAHLRREYRRVASAA